MINVWIVIAIILLTFVMAFSWGYILGRSNKKLVKEDVIPTPSFHQCGCVQFLSKGSLCLKHFLQGNNIYGDCANIETINGETKVNSIIITSQEDVRSLISKWAEEGGKK